MNGLHFLEGTSAVGTTAELDGEVVTALAPTFYCGLGGRPIDGTPAAWRAAGLEPREKHSPHLPRSLRLFTQ